MLARIKVEEAEIDLDVTVGRLQPAPLQNAIARERQVVKENRASRLRALKGAGKKKAAE